MTDRAERRAQKARNVERWRRVYRKDSTVMVAKWIEHSVHLGASHGKLCSCRMCGNPRRYFGAVTVQEARAAEAFRLDGID